MWKNFSKIFIPSWPLQNWCWPIRLLVLFCVIYWHSETSSLIGLLKTQRGQDMDIFEKLRPNAPLYNLDLKKNYESCNRVAMKLQRSKIFYFYQKIHLHLRLWSISRCQRIFEAFKIWSRSFQRFFGKIYILLGKIVQQIHKNMYIAWKNVTIISIKEILFFIHKVLFQRQTKRHF